MNILHRDDLKLGGFAGLKEHRLVTDSRLFGNYKSNNAWDGLGNFVYLADAKFLPYGETKMHEHLEIDVISVMVKGKIKHEGSLEHGQTMHSKHIQVQRAGGEGFSHNEINPDNIENRMIQLWVLPQTPNQASGYKLYEQKDGELMQVYGGQTKEEEFFNSATRIDIGFLYAGYTLALNGEFVAYITQGKGLINGVSVKDGDLLRDKNLKLIVKEDMQIILIRYKHIISQTSI